MAVTESKSETKRFSSPFEIETPPGAEGWQRMYPHYLLFSEENREYEDGTLWFWDCMHLPQAQKPFETIAHECWRYALSVGNSRLFAIPPSFGIDVRMINGYQYTTGVPVTDPKEIEARVAVFLRRAGHYYENWDKLFTQWKQKTEALIRSLEALEVPELPDLETEEFFLNGGGMSTGNKVMAAYDRAIEMTFTNWQYHFEMLNIGFAAYLNLFMFCWNAFPGITDQTIAQLVAGKEVLYFRPDEEIRKLAQLATELGIVEALRADAAPETILESLRADDNGRRWVEAFETAKDPWFNLSTGGGFYVSQRSWKEDLRLPWSALLGYLTQLEQGQSLAGRSLDLVLARRDELTAGYRELLGSDEERNVFDQNVGLARLVAPYMEDHGFYTHDWFHNALFNKIREFGQLLVNSAFLDDVEDVFYLNRWEIAQALYEAVTSWAMAAPTPGTKGHWKREIAARKDILTALQAWTPPPALGPVPAEITEPALVLLWGITPDRVRQWLGEGSGSDDEVRGVAGSPGVITGRARVVASVGELGDLQDGEVLVCTITEPAWSSAFPRIKAAVSDIGGIMSHSAVVSREYELPAVVGTGNATKVIRTGDLVEVDGNSGVVKILERAEA